MTWRSGDLAWTSRGSLRRCPSSPCRSRRLVYHLPRLALRSPALESRAVQTRAEAACTRLERACPHLASLRASFKGTRAKTRLRAHSPPVRHTTSRVGPSCDDRSLASGSERARLGAVRVSTDVVLSTRHGVRVTSRLQCPTSDGERVTIARAPLCSRGECAASRRDRRSKPVIDVSTHGRACELTLHDRCAHMLCGM